MSIRDRGNIKWTAMMLTEHREALERLAEKTKERVKPEVDQQKLEEMNGLLCQSLAQGSSVQITYFQSSNFHRVGGTLKAYHPIHRELLLEDEAGNEITLLLENIVDVSL